MQKIKLFFFDPRSRSLQLEEIDNYAKYLKSKNIHGVLGKVSNYYKFLIIISTIHLYMCLINLS